MFIHTQLYFDNQVSCQIRGWRIDQVLSLKYFFNGAIAPAHCTGAGVGASTSLWCTFAYYALLVRKSPDKCSGCMVSVYKPLSIGTFTMMAYISVNIIHYYIQLYIL